MLGLLGAPECYQVQPSAELTSQVLPKATKIHNIKVYVAAEKTTNISETMTKKVENTPTPVTKEKYSEPNLEKSTDTVDRIQ